MYHPPMTLVQGQDGWKRCFERCTNQEETASCVCLNCRRRDVTLCGKCGRRHVDDNENHIVVWTCQSHGSPVDQFCRTCSCAVCAICHRREHANHGLEQYCKVIEQIKTELKSRKNSLALTSSKLLVQETDLRRLKTGWTKRSDVAMNKAKARFDKEEGLAGNTIVSLCRSAQQFAIKAEEHSAVMEHHREAMEYHRKQLEHHQNEMQKHKLAEGREIEEKARILEDAKRIDSERTEALQDIKDDYENGVKDIQAAIDTVVSIYDKLNTVTRRSDELLGHNLLLPGLSTELETNRKELESLATLADNDDSATPLRAKYGVKKEFSSASRFFGCEVLDSQFVIRNISYMCSDRIAGCGWTRLDGTNKVFTLNLPSPIDSPTSTERVIEISEHRFMGLAAEDLKLVVLVDKIPKTTTEQEDVDVSGDADGHSSIFHVIDFNRRDEANRIGISLRDEAIDTVWNVALDGRGNFLLTYSVDNQCVLALINEKGDVIEEISTIDQYKLTFCKNNELVVLCANTTPAITCYKLTNSGFVRIMDTEHDEEGFACDDICSGGLGEIFIVGRMEGDAPQEVRLYQLDINVEEETSFMKRVDIGDTEIWSWDGARCSLLGDRLVISYDNKIEVLNLSP